MKNIKKTEVIGVMLPCNECDTILVTHAHFIYIYMCVCVCVLSESTFLSV